MIQDSIRGGKYQSIGTLCLFFFHLILLTFYSLHFSKIFSYICGTLASDGSRSKFLTNVYFNKWDSASRYY